MKAITERRMLLGLLLGYLHGYLIGPYHLQERIKLGSNL